MNVDPTNIARGLILPPLSLYIHIPWCVRKCPYCDFNSHGVSGTLPVAEYIASLIADCKQDAHYAQGRDIQSIFFGGGTPSLLSGQDIGNILRGIGEHFSLAKNCEITLESNPGTAEYSNFEGYLAAGVNRLSLGAQSFNESQLNTLGRIHAPQDTSRAYGLARAAGFNNINLDLMFALPQQSCAEAMADLDEALALAPEHLSWYQLTIEPNTAFYSKPPRLPDDDTSWEIQQSGMKRLAKAGYQQYEVSAYSRPEREAKHNRNYWEFGDYLALGAGAHGKITLAEKREIVRYNKTRQPDHYLQALKNGRFTAHCESITQRNLPFEFMMNALRLNQGVPAALFQQRTGLALESVAPQLSQLKKLGLLLERPDTLAASDRGRQYLNSLLEAFLVE